MARKAVSGGHTYDLVELGGSNAVVKFGDYNTGSFAAYEPTRRDVHVDKGQHHVQVMNWGKGNDLPAQRESLIIDNAIIPSLMRTARNALVGEGLLAYEEIFEGGKRRIEEVQMDSQVADFLEMIDEESYLDAAAAEITKHSSIPVEFKRTVNRKAIASIKVLENKFCRKAKRENGISPGTVVHDWNSGLAENTRIDQAKYRPTFNWRDEGLIKHRDQVAWYEDWMFNDGYYATPSWWGDWEWIDLANRIPRFHKAGLDNGWNIRYHVQVPKNYFDGSGTAMSQSRAQIRSAKADGESATSKAETERKDNKAKFLAKLDECFKGVTNNGRILMTTYEINVAVGKEFPGVKIEVIDNKLQGDAMQKLYDSSNQANISAMGVPAGLAAIQTAGKMSAGAEMRNSFIMYMALQTRRPRAKMIKPIYDAMRRSGVKMPHKLGFRDLDITKLDESKSATKDVVAGEAVQERKAA